MKSLKETLLLIIGLAIILGSFYLFLQKPAPARYQPKVSTWQVDTLADTLLPTVKIGEETITVEIADTDAFRERGLSGRTSLALDHGLLFLFDIPGMYGFWMNEMNFPIDIIWIDESWQVVGVEREVSPDSYPQIFYPSRAIKYVLEVPSGTATRISIDAGEKVYFDTAN